MTIEWQAEQVCGECGKGVFAFHKGLAICTVCGHEHPMNPWNLGERERFEWVNAHRTVGPTLHVTAYDASPVGALSRALLA